MNCHFILFRLSFYFVSTKIFVRNTSFVQTFILYCSKSFCLNKLLHYIQIVLFQFCFSSYLLCLSCYFCSNCHLWKLNRDIILFLQSILFELFYFVLIVIFCWNSPIVLQLSFYSYWTVVYIQAVTLFCSN